METKKESDEAIRNVDKVNWENGRNNGEEKWSSDPLIFQSRKKKKKKTINSHPKFKGDPKKETHHHRDRKAKPNRKRIPVESSKSQKRIYIICSVDDF